MTTVSTIVIGVAPTLLLIYVCFFEDGLEKTKQFYEVDLYHYTEYFIRRSYLIFIK